MQDVDAVRRRGHVYNVGPAWFCTSHGAQLQPAGGILRAPCCGLEVRP